MQAPQRSYTPEWGPMEWLKVTMAGLLLLVAVMEWFAGIVLGMVKSTVANLPALGQFANTLACRLLIVALFVAAAVFVLTRLYNWREAQVKRYVEDLAGTEFSLDDPDIWATVLAAKRASISFRLIRKKEEPSACFMKPKFKPRESDNSYDIFVGSRIEVCGTPEQQKILFPKGA